MRQLISKKIKQTILLIFSLLTITTTAHAEMVDTNTVDYVIQRYICENNESLNINDVAFISQNILFYSYQYDVDPLVVTAMIKTESNFHQEDISSAGAIGLGQLMPDTAKAVGVNPYSPQENIEGACSYLSTQIRNFSNVEYPVETALAAYNAGPNAVREYGGIPPYSETQNYVAKIRNEYFYLYNVLAMYLG